MSKHNKVNPGYYRIGGRLTPDDMARERAKQRPSIPKNDTPHPRTASPPWAPKDEAADASGSENDAGAADTRADADADANADVEVDVDESETEDDSAASSVPAEGRSRTSGRVIAAGRSASRTGKRASAARPPTRGSTSAKGVKAPASSRRAKVSRSTTPKSTGRGVRGPTAKGRKR